MLSEIATTQYTSYAPQLLQTVFRAVELQQRQQNNYGATCPPTVPGIKVTALGKVLTTSCEAMPPNGPQCVDPTSLYVTLNSVEYYLLERSAAYYYKSTSPEGCASGVPSPPPQPLP